MKKSILFLVFLLFVSHHISAQGWMWARTGTSASQGFYEAWGSVTTGRGVTYSIGVAAYISTGPWLWSMGSVSVYDSSNLDQTIVSKFDSAGNIKWAIGTQGSSTNAYNIVMDNTENVYILGSYNSTDLRIGGIGLTNLSGGNMYYLAKIDSAGHVVWAKNIVINTSSGGYSFLATSGICIDNLNGIYIAGILTVPTASIGGFTLTNHDPSATTSDVFVAKYDTAGTVLWAQNYGGPKDDKPTGIAAAKNGGIYLVGFYTSLSVAFGGIPLTRTTADSADMFITRISSSGVPVWANKINTSSPCYLSAIATDAWGYAYISGMFNQYSITFGTLTLTKTTGVNNSFLVKYDSSGNAIWAKIQRGSAGIDEGHNIVTDKCGNIWLNGQMEGDTGSIYTMNFDGHILHEPAHSIDPAFFVEYDTAGNYETSFALPTGGDDMGTNASVDNKGNFYLVADFEPPVIILGLDTLTLGVAMEQIVIAKYKYAYPNCVQDTLPLITLSTNNLQESMHQNIEIFPNPAFNECTIKAETDFAPGSIAALYDLMGRLINSYPLSGNNTEISTVNLTPGMYQFRIYTAGNSPITKKLVIMK